MYIFSLNTIEYSKVLTDYFIFNQVSQYPLY